MLDFNSFNEAVYTGNIGVMELMNFYKIATPDQKKKLELNIKNKNSKAAWNIIQKVVGVKLHKSVYEEKKSPNPDVLDRKSTRLNSSHSQQSRMPSSA